MAAPLFAQSQQTSGNQPYSIKIQGFMGGYLSPSGNIKDIGPNAPTGINFGVELPSTRQKPWQQYLNDPAVGVGMSYLNFGNDVMGEGIALYPYIMLNALTENRCQIRPGSGQDASAYMRMHRVRYRLPDTFYPQR